MTMPNHHVPPISSSITAARGASARRTAQAIANSSTGRLEEVLGNVAGFQQFRRSDSRSSNPTAQGVTLRGLGGNASSRTLVVLDAVPVTDPFFGHVPFSALPFERLDRVTVLRGGGSGAFGAGAVAGIRELAAIEREAAADTRVKKTGTAAAELRSVWRKEATDLGHSPRSVIDTVNHAGRAQPEPAKTTVAEIVTALSDRKSVWHDLDVLREPPPADAGASGFVPLSADDFLVNARAILDGHIVLSRELADGGQVQLGERA